MEGNRRCMKFFVSSMVAACRYFSSKISIGSFQTSLPSSWGKPSWTDQQLQVLNAISHGKSVFVTGSAGTGKTILLRHIIERLNEMYGQSRVFVTASTGVAACGLEGQTIHYFSGTGLGDEDAETLLYKVLTNKNAFQRWRTVKALVIDEISMIDGDFFDSLEYIARVTRGDGRVWGGIQLVVSGDFFQLPPVDKMQAKLFAFEANCWQATFDHQIELTRIFRQTDAQLIKLLQGIRKGLNDPEDLKLLQICSSDSNPDPSSIRLYPRIEDVYRVNKKHLEDLNEKIIVYNAIDSGGTAWKKQLRLGIAPDRLELCVGARVMLTRNINPSLKLVNGSTGTLVDFCVVSDGDAFAMKLPRVCEAGHLLPVVQFDSGPKLVIGPETWATMNGNKVVARRKQIPLILAWALSIHKCQGMTLDSLHTDLRRAFGFGMVYVALSRVRSLNGLHLSGLSPSKIKANPKVLQFYEGLSSAQGQDLEHAHDSE